eukprot:scaffold249288_cov15-Tisochrysis_lutea.AAC.1
MEKEEGGDRMRRRGAAMLETAAVRRGQQVKMCAHVHLASISGLNRAAGSSAEFELYKSPTIQEADAVEIPLFLSCYCTNLHSKPSITHRSFHQEGPAGIDYRLHWDRKYKMKGLVAYVNFGWFPGPMSTQLVCHDAQDATFGRWRENSDNLALHAPSPAWNFFRALTITTGSRVHY